MKEADKNGLAFHYGDFFLCFSAVSWEFYNRPQNWLFRIEAWIPPVALPSEKIVAVILRTEGTAVFRTPRRNDTFKFYPPSQSNLRILLLFLEFYEKMFKKEKEKTHLQWWWIHSSFRLESKTLVTDTQTVTKTDGFNIITVVGISNKLFPRRRPVCINENNQQRREHVTRSTSKCILTT